MTRGIAKVALFLGCIGCANNVPQDRSTGPDGKQKGAKVIKLELGDGSGRPEDRPPLLGVAKGIVTYPGGDRVDWRVVELPEGKKGRLDLSMKWTTPRPGLQLGFDVFDQWNQPVANAKGSKGRVREATLAMAKGKYYVRVFAKGRGDAGQYKLAVAFKEQDEIKVPDPLAMEVPEPPRLPAVPGQCEPFDPKDPGCIDVCPPSGAPKGWKACDVAGGTTTTPPPPPVVTPPPPPPVVAKPILGRVISVTVQSGSVIVTIGAGSEQGVDKTWKGKVMRGDTNQPIVGGTVQIIRVDKLRTIAKVGLTTDIVTANPLVLLEP